MLQVGKLCGADLFHTVLTDARLDKSAFSGGEVDFSVLSGTDSSSFIADAKICKQLVEHAVKIKELSGVGSEELLT